MEFLRPCLLALGQALRRFFLEILLVSHPSAVVELLERTARYDRLEWLVMMWEYHLRYQERRRGGE